MQHCEIERKYLIRLPEERWLLAQPGCRVRQITQTYLTAEAGWERRVRCCVENGTARYTETRKTEQAALCRTEIERELTAEEYHALLREELPGGARLEKVRYAFPYGGHTVEIDRYPFWTEQAVLEVELTDEDEVFTLPPELAVLQEVTDDPMLKNRALALARG